MSGHEIVWEFDDDTVLPKVVCNERASGADCRVTCVEDCESWDKPKRDSAGVYHVIEGYDGDPDERHEMREVDYCNVAEWMNQANEIEEFGPDDTFEIGRTPILPTFDGDGYVWERA